MKGLLSTTEHLPTYLLCIHIHVVKRCFSSKFITFFWKQNAEDFKKSTYCTDSSLRGPFFCSHPAVFIHSFINLSYLQWWYVYSWWVKLCLDFHVCLDAFDPLRCPKYVEAYGWTWKFVLGCNTWQFRYAPNKNKSIKL